jgi:lysophospholipase L1-like esterase
MAVAKDRRHAVGLRHIALVFEEVTYMRTKFFRFANKWMGIAIAVTVLTTSAAAAEVRIVALGDSGIRGKGVPESQAYPAQLEAALRARGHQVTVTNAGINGDTTVGVLGRLDSAVPTGTDIVILTIGFNDLVAHHVSSADVAANKRTIVERLRAKGAEVYLLEHMQQGIIDRGDLHVESSRGNPTQWHLNQAGYAIVVRRTVPAIETLVRKVEKRR